jgi:hypothetical protein
MGDPVRVALLFSRAERVIGLRAPEEGEDAFAVHRQQRIHCAKFVRMLEIPASISSIRLPAEMEDGILVAQLPQREGE